MEEILDQIDSRSSLIVQNALDQQQDPLAQIGMVNPQPLTPAIGAGGSTSGMPPTLSQEYLQFVDGTDEVPDWIRRKYWAIVTRMNQLTQIKDDKELARVEASIRAMIRPFIWKTNVTSEEIFMLQHYTKTQILKARGGIERRLIAPQLQEITKHETYSDGTVLTKQANQNPGFIRGAMDGIFGR